MGDIQAETGASAPLARLTMRAVPHLETFENGLPIVQRLRAGHQAERAVGLQTASPALALSPGRQELRLHYDHAQGFQHGGEV